MEAWKLMYIVFVININCPIFFVLTLHLHGIIDPFHLPPTAAGCTESWRVSLNRPSTSLVCSLSSNFATIVFPNTHLVSRNRDFHVETEMRKSLFLIPGGCLEIKLELSDYTNDVDSRLGLTCQLSVHSAAN